jgi:putative glycosyltransferase (TIGR04372 family)
LTIILNKFLPEYAAKFIKFVLFSVVSTVPPWFIRFIPPIFCNIFGQIAQLQNRDINEVILWFQHSQKNKFSRKLGFGLEAGTHIIFPDAIDGNQKFTLNYLSSREVSMQHFEIIRSYSLWNLDFERNYACLSNLKKRIEDIDRNSDYEFNQRFLPEFTSNMGHLGFLYFYICYYNKFGNNREIRIWPDIAPNKLFLEKVLQICEFKVINEPGRPPMQIRNLLQNDNLLFSRISKGDWRFEINTTSFNPQIFPEINSENRPLLKLNESELEFGSKELKTIGMDSNKWIVLLHIRENKLGNVTTIGQARDCSVLEYREFCEVIRDLGGQVIRMGDKDFPRLPSDFPAIDYAHSEIKSEILDIWLWSQAKWTTVNPNGAMMPPMAFGTPRLITNQWFWDNVGDQKDMFVPKLLYSEDKKRLLKLNEVMAHPLSRTMDKNILRKANLILVDNSATTLRDAALDFYSHIKSGKTKNENNLTKNFKKIFRNEASKHSISVPNSFSDTFFHEISE